MFRSAALASILGVDRLDYTKGLVERLRAFETLLGSYPQHLGRVTYIQIAAPSREMVPEYVEIRAELERLAGAINGRFGELDWTPVHYLSRSYSQAQLAALYRHCQVGLVAPLRDGMNLVAKEYVAAQNPYDPGVLVLSRFAGASERLDGARIVNPYDNNDMAEALHAALEMPLAERRLRWRKMIDGVERNDISQWRRSFLRALKAAPEDRSTYRAAS